MNKQLKSPRLIILVMILSLMSVLVAGCGDDKYVQSVKNGTMYRTYYVCEVSWTETEKETDIFYILSKIAE